jgi:hypothetical protein
MRDGTESMEEKETNLRDERWEAESMEKKTILRDERQREGRGGGWESENGDLNLGLENMLFILFFFFSRASLVEPGRFGSVRFNRFQTLKTETKPNRKYFVIF